MSGGRYVLDGRGAAVGGTGISAYVRGLARGFVELDVSELRVLCYRSERKEYRRLGVRPWPIPSGRFFRPWQLPPVTLTHGPNFRALDCRRARRVITIHDLAFVRYPDDYPRDVAADLSERLRQQQSVVDHVICDSAATERDVLDAYPGFVNRTSVIHLGVDPAWFEAPSHYETEHALGSFGIETPYILHLGALVPRKDIPTLVRAWKLLREQGRAVDLVLAGPPATGWKSDVGKISEILDESPRLRPGLRLLDEVDEATALRLMSGAAAYASTSKLEGFGLPVLQAMAAGTPVVATRCEAAVEVAGSAVFYAEIGDPEGVAAALLLALDRSDPAQLAFARDRARTFTWRRCAESTLDCYRRLIA